MTPLTIVVIAFVLALLLFGFAFWTPIYAIPLALLFLAGFAVAHGARRHRSSDEWNRERAKAERSAGPGASESPFTERDRQSLSGGR